MNGLPKSFQIETFLDRTLEQICFAEYQMSLSFGRACLVTVESSFRYEYKDELVCAVNLQESWVLLPDLSKIIGQRIVRCTSPDRKTLGFHFDNDYHLYVLDDSTSYESYRILVDGIEIFV